MKVNGPGNGNQDKEEILALTKHTWLYSDLLRAFKGKHSSAVCFFNGGDLNISASAAPNNKDTFKTKRNGKLQHIKLFKE